MARTPLARRLGVACLLTTVVLSMTACGGGETSSADPTTSESAADPSRDTDGSESTDTGGGTETEDVSGDLEELSAAQFYPAVMAALQEAETMGFSLSTGVGATAMDLVGNLRYAGDTIEMTAATTGAQAFEMVMLDKTLYLSGAAMPLPDGKTWLKVDLSDPNSLLGQLGRSTDPSMMFKAMEEPKSFELVGTEAVDGVETNHYTVVMDTAAYAAAMDLSAEMAKAMPEEIATEVWIDADNQPRKFRQELELPDMTGSGQSTRTTTEGTYFDFGADVDIEAPPASEVADNIPGMS